MEVIEAGDRPILNRESESLSWRQFESGCDSGSDRATVSNAYDVPALMLLREFLFLLAGTIVNIHPAFSIWRTDFSRSQPKGSALSNFMEL